MSTDVWLPLVALAAGYALSMITEALRDRRLARRETLVRQAEYERTTLTELQEALNDLMRCFGEVHLIRAKAERQEQIWNRVQLPGELEERMRLAERSTTTLASRVASTQVREGIEEIKRKGNILLMSPSYDQADNAFLESIQVATDLLKLMGEQIRKSLV